MSRGEQEKEWLSTNVDVLQLACPTCRRDSEQGDFTALCRGGSGPESAGDDDGGRSLEARIFLATNNSLSCLP